MIKDPLEMGSHGNTKMQGNSEHRKPIDVDLIMHFHIQKMITWMFIHMHTYVSIVNQTLSLQDAYQLEIISTYSESIW